MAQALGAPIIRELGSRADDTAERDDFFSVADPKLIEGKTVDICATHVRCILHRRAARRCVSDPVAAKKTVSEQEVELYSILVRSGTFYLIGYDRERKSWRKFAIDHFALKAVASEVCASAAENAVRKAWRHVSVPVKQKHAV